MRCAFGLAHKSVHPYRRCEVLSIRKNKGITSLTFSSYSRDADVCLEGVCVLRCTYSRCKRVSKETSRTIEKRTRDRKSTRLNSSHLVISYAVFCLKKK